MTLPPILFNTYPTRASKRKFMFCESLHCKIILINKNQDNASITTIFKDIYKREKSEVLRNQQRQIQQCGTEGGGGV